MNPTRINQMNMAGLDRGALDSYSLKFGYPLDTHRLWERAAFGYLIKEKGHRLNPNIQYSPKIEKLCTDYAHKHSLYTDYATKIVAPKLTH